MICNEAEYRGAAQLIGAERIRLLDYRTRLRSVGLTDDEVKRVTDPMKSFHMQLIEEVEHYEWLKRREFDEL